MALGERSVQSQAVCLASFGWMDNNSQQIPCIVAGYLLAQCNEGTWTVTANTDPTRHYDTPNETTANKCSCSWAVYNSLQACALCQAGSASSVATWTSWSTNCSDFLSTSDPWPKGTVIPAETSIPFWAVTDPNTWNDAKFNGSAAQDIANENKPDITNDSFNGSGKSSSSSTPTGAIAGGVVGGVLLIALIGLLVFYLRCRRSASNRRARGVSMLSLTNTHARTPSDGTGGTTLFNYGQAGGKYFQATNGVNVPGLGYLGGRGGVDVDRDFTSPLMSGTPESQGVTMNSYSPGLGSSGRPPYQQTPSYVSGRPGSTSTSMLMGPGTSTTPVPMPAVPPGVLSMAVSPISGQGTLGVVNAGPSTLGGSATTVGGAGGGSIMVAPNSPPNPSITSISFASRTGHGHTVSNTSNMSTVHSGHGHGHSQSNSGSVTSGEIPEGAISPFIMPAEDGGAEGSDPNNTSTTTATGTPNASFAYVATSTPLRKPYERARINPPAYSPTASPEENMFASAQGQGQGQGQQGAAHGRSASTALSFTALAASNEATGGHSLSLSDATVAMSGTTLARGAGGGTIGSVGTGVGTVAGSGPETLVGSAEGGVVRSPSPVEEERSDRERDAHGYPVDRKI